MAYFALRIGPESPQARNERGLGGESPTALHLSAGTPKPQPRTSPQCDTCSPHPTTPFRRFAHLYTSNQATDARPMTAAVPSCSPVGEASRKKSRKSGM